VRSRLAELGEHGWIARLVRRLGDPRGAVRIGPGDDAAAIRVGGATVLVTTDALVDGVHFRRTWLGPRALGQRAFRVNASDLAAMGGRPFAAVLAFEVPRETTAACLDGIVAGFVAEARRHGAWLIGGNLTRGQRLAITVTMLGRAPARIVTRAGARPGDLVFVTGDLGRIGTAVRGRAVHLPPVPDRVDAGVALARVASAMIDVSDGLVQDVGHVARASRVRIQLDGGRIPVAAACRRRFGRRAATVAATAGEDYELALTVPPRRLRALERLRGRLGCCLTQVGVVAAGTPGVVVRGPDGRRVALARRGFDHLRARRSGASLAGLRRRR
jgi:thiamine-monophosphate kinase